jgi:hypothetical protein
MRHQGAEAVTWLLSEVGKCLEGALFALLLVIDQEKKTLDSWMESFRAVCVLINVGYVVDTAHIICSAHRASPSSCCPSFLHMLCFHQTS